MKHFFLILFSLLQRSVFANDGAYYTSGNQLIPITETDISVKKEILHLKKIGEYMEVSVYYEFFNPKNEKEILVGFEALPATGDADSSPKNGNHRYMEDFLVNLNGKKLPHKVAIVPTKNYHKNGKFTTLTKNQIENDTEHLYVYHFKAKFKKGLNTVRHTYRYKLSGSVDTYYDFSYVLTAANRWANKQIDDFTLILDMGNYESFDITKTFFTKENEWKMNGLGKSYEEKYFADNLVSKFHIHNGVLVFEKKNFKPKGELFVSSRKPPFSTEESFTELPLSPNGFDGFDISLIAKTNEEKQILKNLPFARRGYVFKNEALKNFYENQKWYIANPNYQPDVKSLTSKEQKWLEILSISLETKEK